jgi:predicted Fe-S protein YdhL (DUF1289 family)
VLDVDSGLCLGCGRSLEEIARWGGITDAERSRIMKELPRRRAMPAASPTDKGVKS